MDTQAIDNLGGILQLIGTVLVVADLLAVHSYLGHSERLEVWLRARRASAVAGLRRLLGRPAPPAVIHASAIIGGGITLGGTATAHVMPGPLVHRPDLSPAEQLAAHADYLNQLHSWVATEVAERDQAIRAERAQARAELQAERERVDRLVGERLERFNRLRRLIINGIGLRWLGVLLLLMGTAFSTWPDGWAEVWPAWVSSAALVLLAMCAVAGSVCWAIQATLRADGA
jgi:hypothetical protein